RELVTLEGARQTLAMGPTASQEAIKMLGINGGGFFNANSAHPFENPTPLTNFVQMLSMLAIPAGLTWTYGRIARAQGQGWALIFVLLTVFIAGLMVGRTPEYLGKKIEAREMKFAMLYVLIFPLLILGFSAWGAAASYAKSSVANAGPHGLSEILYAFSSGAGNNGSAFAGLNANTRFWNVAMAFDMLAGRFLMMVPVLAIAGSMVGKKVVPAGPGTFPTNGALF